MIAVVLFFPYMWRACVLLLKFSLAILLMPFTILNFCLQWFVGKKKVTVDNP